MKSTELEALLATDDDYELCRGVFGRFAAYSNVIDVDAYSEEERIVTLVWHAKGLIDNGGFEYLFAGEFNGDPGFVYTAAAFNSIRASEAYSAIQRALGLFGGRMPSDPKDRIAVYRRAATEEERNALDFQFSADDANVRTGLARYIRERRDRFRGLLSSPPPKRSFLKRFFR